MKRRYQPADLSRVRTVQSDKRPTKVHISSFARVCDTNPSLSAFLDSLPHLLKAHQLRAVIDAMATAYQQQKPVIAGIGGHIIKCGLSPLIIRLMERGIITMVAMNGGASIHDTEIALLGSTSEDVGEALEHGMFGMVREIPEFMNSAISAGAKLGLGMGEALGGRLNAIEAPYKAYSIMAAGTQLGVPVTVHVAMGGDTIHMHPSADGAALGTTSMTDFRLLTTVLHDFGNGGVYLNIGSAVVLPEVFLKALNLARNLSEHSIEGFTTVNMDMLQHYRPLENVVRRPSASTSAGYTITGHHEIMLPLIAQLVLDRLAATAGQTERGAFA